MFRFHTKHSSGRVRVKSYYRLVKNYNGGIQEERPSCGVGKNFWCRRPLFRPLSCALACCPSYCAILGHFFEEKKLMSVTLGNFFYFSFHLAVAWLTLHPTVTGVERKSIKNANMKLHIYKKHSWQRGAGCKSSKRWFTQLLIYGNLHLCWFMEMQQYGTNMKY